MIDLLNKNLKTVIITVSYVFKKLKGRLSMLMTYKMYKDSNWISRKENYNVWDEKCTRWN